MFLLIPAWAWSGTSLHREETVLNGTASLLPVWDHQRMRNKKTKKKSFQALLASVKNEMAQPRVAESAQTEAGRYHPAPVKEAAKP
jgi:hypothetical protein